MTFFNDKWYNMYINNIQIDVNNLSIKTAKADNKIIELDRHLKEVEQKRA